MPFEMNPDVLAAMTKIFGGSTPVKPALHDIEARRQNMAGLMALVHASAVPADNGVTAKDYYASAKDGHQILMRYFSKGKEDNKPAVLYMHGGGMISGNIDGYDPVMKNYVARTGASFLNVEFRYAPENPYPTSVEDCHAALQWLHDHAKELGIDDSRIAIMGDSGGGGLAACLAHYAKEQNGPAIAKQILIYPMLDDRNIVPDPLLVPFALWNYVDNETGWFAVLGDKFGTENVPPTAAPARMTVEQAKGLPDVYIDVGELDIFRDEDIEYARKCAAAGVSVELHVYPSVPHAFEVFATGCDISKEALEHRFKAIESIKSVKNAKL